MDRALDALGDLEVVVGNAGIGVAQPAKTVECSDTLWDRMLHIHLTAPFVMARAAILHFIARGGGVVINVSSIAGQVAFPGKVAHNTAKAA